jgi:hypothetical protein
MVRPVLGFLLAALVAVSASAQKSAAADKQAGSWFDNGRDSFLKRTGALQAADLDLFEAAAKKSGLEASRQQLFFTLPKFNPLFDSKYQIVAGAVAKYAKRLEQTPMMAIEEWTAMTGGERLLSAISLTAENGVFPGEKFSEQGFRALATKFK